MINHTYLQKGLLATARSHQAGYMAGHLGASVLAWLLSWGRLP